MSAEKQQDQAILILDSNLAKLSKLYKESYLSEGKGALLVYATDVIKNGTPKKSAYRTKKEMLEVFDTPISNDKLVPMINDYVELEPRSLDGARSYLSMSAFG